jgi:hypothetical protein
MLEPPSAMKAPLLATGIDGGAAVVMSDVEGGSSEAGKEAAASGPAEPQEGTHRARQLTHC